MSDHGEVLLHAVVAYSADAALLCDSEMVISYASPPIQALFGWTPDQVVGHHGLTFVHPDDVPHALAVLAKTCANPGPQPPLEFRLRTADGSYVWTEAVFSNQVDDMSAQGLVVNLRNIELRKKSELALADSERRYRVMVEAADEGIWMLDPEGRGVFANPRLEQMLEVAPGGLMRRKMTDFLHPDDVTLLFEHVEQCRNGVRCRLESRLVSASGRVLDVLISGHPLFDDSGRYLGTQGLITDISPLKAALARLETLAVRDELTSLPNQALLSEHIRAALAPDHPDPSIAALLLLDVDDLASVNDSFGYRAADHVVVTLGQRLAARARPGDVVARLTTGEFAVLCRGLHGPVDAIQLAERFQEVAKEPLEMLGRTLAVTVSVGIAMTPARSAETLLRDAVAAAHQARRKGSGRVAVYSESLRRQTHHELTLSDDLRRALKSTRGLVVDFQPVLSLHGLQVVGAEALVRWQHPERGLLLPDAFIPLAERTGQVADLDRWVLGTAMDYLARWCSSEAVSSAFTVSVNISGHHYTEAVLADEVHSVLARTGISPSQLMLEVTETAVITDVEAASDVMQQLKRLGVGLAIDDFGTGYASLEYLRRFPVDLLKIDHGFVADIGHDSAADALVVNVLELARSVGIACVAEGVETAQQLELLKGNGCVFGQGYLWSRPMSAEQLPGVVTALNRMALTGVTPS